MFPHIFVSKMMTSTRKAKSRDAAPDPGTVMLSKLSLAASEARKATMASIEELLDNAAAENGGRVPRGFISKVIQQFSKVTPGSTIDQINHYYKKEYKKEHESGPKLALASLPQNDERGTTNGSALVVAPESLLAISLQQNDASPPRK
jgi:hypothetical protein